MSGLRSVYPGFKGASLRVKMIALIGCVSVALIVLPYALAQLILLQNVAHLENQEIHRNTERMVNILNSQLENMNTLAYGWAHWDDTYQYMQDRSPLFLERNMGDTTLKTLGISLILIMDDSSQLVYGKHLNPQTGESRILSPELINLFLSEAVMTPQVEGTARNMVSGVVVVPYGPMLIAIDQILDSHDQGPSRGFLVVGHYLDHDELQRITAATILAVDFRAFNDPDLPEDFQKALDKLNRKPGIANFALSGSQMAGYALVNDISGEPALILRIIASRDTYRQGRDAIYYFMLIFVASGVILLAAVYWLVNRIVLARLLRLSAEVRRIGKTGELSRRVPVTGRDELAALGSSINTLLGATEQSQAALRLTHEELEQRVRDLVSAEEALHESQERLELALQATGLGLWDWSGQTDQAVFDQRWAEMIGYTQDEVGSTGKIWRDSLHPDDRDRVMAVLNSHLEGRLPFYECEYRLRTKAGDYRWILARGKVVRRDEHGLPLRIIGTQQDISVSRERDAERERLVGELHTRTVELAAVAEISRQITTILDIKPLLWTICQLIKDKFDLYHVHIYLVDDQGQELKLVAGQGEIGRQLVAHQHSIPLTHEHSLVARAARTHESVVINDVEQSDEFLPNPLLPDTRSELALPMLVGSTLVGVLDVQGDTVNRFTPEDVNIQTSLAAQVAIAIHNARLFTDSARRLAIIEGSNDGIALADLQAPDTFLLYMNPTGMSLLGYERIEDIMGQPVRDFYPPEEQARLYEEILPVVMEQGIWRGENRILRRDGSVLPVDQVIFVIRDEQGEPRDLATICTDITGRKQSEEALAKMQALLSSAISQVSAGILIAEGPDAQIRLANAAAAEILGQPIDRMPQFNFAHPEERPWTSLNPDRTPYTDDLPLVRAVRNGVSTRDAELIIRRSTGDERWILINAVPVRNAGGEVVAGMSVFVDITERKQSEEALRRANRAYRALSDCNQAMVRAEDEADLLADICQTIVVAGGYRMAWVAYLEGDTHPTLRPVAHAGYEAGYLDEIIPGILHEAGPTFTALRTGTPYVVRDIETDPVFLPWRKAALQRGYRSVIALPLLIEGRPLGILNVYAAEPHVFDLAEINLLMELAGDLAYGLMALRLRAQREQAEEQLRRSEANLTALIENTDDSIWSVDTDLRIITMNSTLKRVFYESYGVELKPGVKATDFMSPEDQEERRAHYRRALSGERFTVEKHYTYTNAAPVDVEISFNPIVADDGVITGVSVFSRDITARKQDAERLHQLNTRLEKHSQELLVLYEIGNALTGLLDVREIYRMMYEGVGRRLLGAPTFMIGLYDEARQTITCDFAMVDGQEIVPSTLPVMPLGSGPNSETIRTRQPRIVRMPDSVFPGRAVLIETDQPALPRSALFVPLISGNQVIGVLSIQHGSVDAFEGVDLNLVTTLANQAATAIQNARLFEAEREQRKLSEALRDTATTITRTLDSTVVIDSILDNLQTVIPHSAANLMLLDAGRVHVVGYRGYAQRGLEEWVRNIDIPVEKMTLLVQMMSTGQSAVISDIDRDYPDWALSPEARWVKSYAGAPIQREGRAIGFLNLYGDVPEFFSPDDADRLHAFADQVAIALRNAQLFTDEREQRALAEALRDTAAAVNQTLDFDDVLDLILEYTGRVVPHDAANIMLIEDGVARLVRGHGYAKYGVEEWVNALRYVVADVPVWQPMIETGQPFAIPDVQTEPSWLLIPEEAWIRSTVKAPIRIEGQTVGILHLDSTTPRAFTQVHAERLQAFADQAAIALRNARLFAAERDQRALAEALRDTAAAINSSLNFDAVAEAILSNVGRVAPYDQADLMLIENGIGRVVLSYPFSTDPVRQRWNQELHFVVADVPNMRIMMETGQPFVISDCHHDAAWLDHPETRWIGSNAGAPIQREGRVIGFLLLNAKTPGFFTQEHANRLQAFADQASLAISNAQLFAEVEQRVRERTLELEQRRAQLQAILDSIGEGVIYDEKLHVRYINRALTLLTGYSPEEYVTYLEPLRSSRYTPEEFQALIRHIYEAVDRLGVWQGEVLLRRKSGTEFDAALFVTPVLDPLEHVIGAVTVIRDISQEKALREQKDRFIASASHELRTPLANFKTRLYLLKNQPEKFSQHIAVLDRVTNGMNELVENLLDVSRFERGVIPMHRRPAVLQEIINDVVSIQIAEAERRELTLVADLYPLPLHASVDPHRLSQVVTNLISNAINYTLPGGEIRVELLPDNEQVPRRALMRVRDTGIGIAPEMLSQVFDPFFRGSEEVGTGAGLGLTIAREIVKLHEGQLRVESEVGRGSVFTMTLDLLDE